MPLITEQGKEVALTALKDRRARNKDRKRVNNASLYAGSPMYYYCNGCGEGMVLSESHLCPAPTLCEECKALKNLGWLE
jgi:hypothetical protein